MWNIFSIIGTYFSFSSLVIMSFIVLHFCSRHTRHWRVVRCVDRFFFVRLEQIARQVISARKAFRAGGNKRSYSISIRISDRQTNLSAGKKKKKKTKDKRVRVILHARAFNRSNERTLFISVHVRDYTRCARVHVTTRGQGCRDARLCTLYAAFERRLEIRGIFKV